MIKFMRKGWFKDLYLYLKYRKEINDCYGFNLEEGYCGDETYDWREKLHYWKLQQD